MGRHRFKLSLSNLLMFAACCAMGLGLWRSYDELGSVRRANDLLSTENRRLRAEYGELEVENPGLLHVAEMRQDEVRIGVGPIPKYDWSWKVRVPEGAPITLRYAVGVVDAESFPVPTLQYPLAPGTHHVRLRFYDESQDGDWNALLLIQSGNYRHTFTNPVPGVPWTEVLTISTTPSKNEWDTVTRRVVDTPFDDQLRGFRFSRPIDAPPDELFQLYRLRMVPLNADGNAAAPGFLIWLSPKLAYGSSTMPSTDYPRAKSVDIATP